MILLFGSSSSKRNNAVLIYTLLLSATSKLSAFSPPSSSSPQQYSSNTNNDNNAFELVTKTRRREGGGGITALFLLSEKNESYDKNEEETNLETTPTKQTTAFELLVKEGSDKVFQLLDKFWEVVTIYFGLLIGCGMLLNFSGYGYTITHDHGIEIDTLQHMRMKNQLIRESDRIGREIQQKKRLQQQTTSTTINNNQMKTTTTANVVLMTNNNDQNNPSAFPSSETILKQIQSFE